MTCTVLMLCCLSASIIQSGFTALHVAARYGNHAIAQLLIEFGADVNFVAKVYNSRSLSLSLS